MRKRIAIVIAVLGCLLALGVAQAGAWTQWAHDEGIKSGESKYSPYVALEWNEVEPAGVGIICAGIRNYGSYCPPEADDVLFGAGGVVDSEAYAHDHSTFTSGFSAWYEA